MTFMTSTYPLWDGLESEQPKLEIVRRSALH